MTEIIVPPPDIREAIEHTREAVRNGGKEAESRILASERNNPKFSFLNQNDPYFPYYSDSLLRNSSIPTDVTALTKENSSQLVEELVDIDSHFVHALSHQFISGYDLDLIKLTSCFVAKNEPSFVSNLLAREFRNSQFDFLKIGNSKNDLYKRLSSSYENIFTNIGIVKTSNFDTVYRDIIQLSTILGNTTDMSRFSESSDIACENDWNNFVIGDIVEFKDFDICEPPTTKTHLLSTSISVKQTIYNMKQNSETSFSQSYSELQYVICPVCKGSIISSEFEHHLKMETISKLSSAQNKNNQEKYEGIPHEVSSESVKRNLSSMLGYTSENKKRR